MIDGLADPEEISLPSSPLTAILYILYLGIKNSVNPCALTTILVFQLFIRQFGYNRSIVLRSGAIFITTVLAIYVLLTFGFLDQFLGQMAVQNSIFITYWVLSIMFIVVGGIHFVDWIRFQKSNNLNSFIIRVPDFLTQKDTNTAVVGEHKNLSDKIFLGSTVILAIVLALLASLWPQDSYIYISSYYLASRGKQILGLLSFVFYGLGYVAPLLVIWSTIFYITRSQKRIEHLLKSVSLIKIILSALFISVGAGLIYFFLI